MSILLTARPHHAARLLLLFSLLLLLVVAATATALPPGSPYHSARCLAQGRSCTPYYADRSRACRVTTPSASQSADCIALACRWCTWGKIKAASQLCQNPTLLSRCDHARLFNLQPTDSNNGGNSGDDSSARSAPIATMPPTPTPIATVPAMAPSPSPQPPADAGGRQPERPAGSCTWEGSDAAVINLGEVTPNPAAGWERTERDGFTGLIYRPTWGAGLTSPSRGGTMCFPVRVEESGDYFLTFVSYAPHVTEHNDAWVRASLPLTLWKTDGSRSFNAGANQFLKAYQSNGAERGMSSEMKTSDNDGHRFTVTGVKAGQAFDVCLSGRSFKFSVFRLVLKKCFGTICSGGGLWRTYIYKMPVSQCV